MPFNREAGMKVTIKFNVVPLTISEILYRESKNTFAHNRDTATLQYFIHCKTIIHISNDVYVAE